MAYYLRPNASATPTRVTMNLRSLSDKFSSLTDATIPFKNTDQTRLAIPHCPAPYKLNKTINAAAADHP